MNNETEQLISGKGNNFAPIKPILDLKDESIDDKTVQNHYLVKELRAKYEEKINLNKQSWREMICAGEIIANFIQGEQILRINSFNGMPKVVKPDLKDPQHIKAINKMQFYATCFQDKWRSSKPDIIVSPLSNNDEAIAQARKANIVIDYLESQFFKTWFDLQEGLSAQIWGWYGRRVRPDFTSKSFHTVKEIWGERETPIGKAYGKCEKCGYKGEEVKTEKINKKSFNLCPQCGDMEYDFTSPVMEILPYKKGSEKVFLPDIICEPLHFPAVRFDLSKRAEESSWFITEKKIETSALRRIFKNIRFPEGESGNDFGLDVIDTLASRGSALGGISNVGKEKSEKTVLTEMYLSADDLYDIKIGGEEKTVEGQTLPQGKRMSDVFPDGCVVIGINGMNLILGIYAECHKDSITSGVYHMKPMSGAGRGVGDAVEIQKQFNRRYSQIDNIFAKRSSPALLTPENAIEERYKRQINNPGAVIPVKLQNFPEIKSISQLVAPIPGESVPGDLIHVTFDRLEQMLQTAYHITNFGGASPQGVSNDTATYAQINDANSDAIFSPALAVKADCNVDTVKNGFYKWVKFTPEARFLPFKKGKSNAVGTEIKGSDVDGEYNWSYVPGSEAPKNRFTEAQKRVGFFSMFGGGIAEYFAMKQQFPQALAEIERDFDVNFETDSYDNVGETCRLRLDRAKQMLKKQPNYLAILAELEPSMLITEPSLTEKAVWFANLLDSEEGLAMSNEERELVSTFVLAFKELSKGQTMQIQVDQAEIEVAAQQPMIDAQMQQQNAQTRQQMEMQSAQQAQQAQIQQEQSAQQIVGESANTIMQNAATEQAQEAEQEKLDNEQAMEAVRMLHEQNENEAERTSALELAKRSKK